MRRIALKFGYDGSSFNGYQRQPERRTVEGEIIETLEAVGAIEDPESSAFQSGSRTDAGVHALANAVAFNTDFGSADLLSALNAKCRHILFHSYLEVPATFNPRKAVMRHYRYLLRGRYDRGRLESALKLFVGTRDFSNFAKSGPGGRFRSIERVGISEISGWTAIDLHGRSFLHNMVRRIVSAAVLAAEGKITEGDIESALSGGPAKSFGLARPEFLILMDIDYGMRFRRVPLTAGTLDLWKKRLYTMMAVEYLYREMLGAEDEDESDSTHRNARNREDNGGS